MARVHRVTGDSSGSAVWQNVPLADMVLTSPPAYPSVRQVAGAVGTEATLDDYVYRVGGVLRHARRSMRVRSHLVMVLQPLDGGRTMELFATLFRGLGLRVLGTFRWSHGDGNHSYVVFLSWSNRVKLDRQHPAVRSREWAIPVRVPSGDYSFFEWPDELVATIVGLALPRGGVIVDPFIGRGRALAALPPKYRVYGVDIDEVATGTGTGRVAVADISAIAGGPNRGVD